MARDSEPSARVFGSKDERDRWQIMQYGNVRNAFREPNEAPDGRPVLTYPDPFWEDYTEQLSYEAAVEANPKREGEGAWSYAKRICEHVIERYAKADKPMPIAMTRKQRDARHRELQRQADEMRRSASLPYRDDAA